MQKSPVSVFRILSLVMLALTLSACSAASSLTSFLGSDRTAIRHITVQAGPQLNRDSGLAVDFLFIRDESLLNELPDTAPQWYGDRERYLIRYSALVDVQSVELVPLSVVQLPMPVDYKKSVKVVMYANFISPAGQTMTVLPDERDITISVMQDSLEIAALQE
jgi:predicted component of type VI protein secretion system